MPGSMPAFGAMAEPGGLPRWLIPAGVGVGVLVIAAIVGVTIGKSIGRPKFATGGDAAAAPSGGLAPSLANPGGDTPDGLAEEFKEHAVALRDTLQAIEDERSRDAAIPKLWEIAGELNELALRAGRLEPLADAEFSAFVKRLGQPPDAQSFDANRGAQLRQRGILSEELTAAALESASALSLAGSALFSGLKALPAAAGEAESLEREKVELMRAAARSVCRVSSGADLDAAAADLERFTAALRALVSKKESLTGIEAQMHQAKTMFLDADVLAGRMISAAAAAAETHGRNDRLAQAVVDLRSAGSQVDFARPGTASNVAQAIPSGAVGPDGPGGPASGPFGPGGPAGLGPAGPGFDPLGDYIRQFGADKVVTFTCPPMENGVRDDLVRKLQGLTGANSNSAEWNNQSTRIVLNYAGDVEALVARIDFATVTSFDAATRTIALQVGNGGGS